MTKILIPTLEEHAYHLGWLSYFNKMPDLIVKNPYNTEVEMGLYECWEDGWTSAEIVAESFANV